MSHHRTEVELQIGLELIKQSPKDQGTLELIVIRPKENERTVLIDAQLSSRLGVHGDDWFKNSYIRLPDGSPHPDVQVSLMNSRCIDLLAQEKSRWPLAGDQLYVDLDLSVDNLPVGQQLSIGSVILQVTDQEHTGCNKFAKRYGQAARIFVNSTVGKQLHLRGIYAKVVQDGSLKVGDRVIKI